MTTAAIFGKRESNKEADNRELPWVEKYRPRNLDEVSAQDHAVTVLKKSLISANLPHMLFYGPPGTGKTSTILALTKELYGPTLSKTRVLELNASDERGISIVREKIKTFARLTVSNPTKEDLENYPCPPYKIIILDEADSMTADAQSALRRTMENYSGVTRFCLICNYITRIIDPLASRCSKFRFRPLDNSEALKRLEYVESQENIRLEDGVLEEVLKISKGDLRKAITFLQSAARLHSTRVTDDHGDIEVVDANDGNISLTSIREIAGFVPNEVLSDLITAAQSKQFKNVFNTVNDVVSQGWSGVEIVNQIHDQLIFNDEIDSAKKNKISWIIFETDQRLTNGTDEHLQILNMIAQLSKLI